MNLGKEEWYSHDCDPGHCTPSLLDLHANLVLEEFRVIEGCFIENKDV